MTDPQVRLHGVPADWVRALVLFVVAGAALYLGAMVASDSAQTLAAIRRIGAGPVVLGTALASLAYPVRFLRWQWLTARLGVRVRWTLNFRVYLAGLALTSSPAKVGETIRSALLVDHGVPVPASLAAFLADRGADVVGMALLGAVAALLAPTLPSVGGTLALVGVGALAVSLVAAGVARGRARRAASSVPAIPRASRFVRGLSRLAAPLAPWSRLWTPGAAVGYAGFAIVAYGIQALVFAGYVAVIGGGPEPARCVTAFAAAMLLGGVSMVPGGLGVTEAALVMQLVEAGMPTPEAIAAAIVLRLSTLWFAIALGIVALLGLARDRRGTTGPTDR